MNVPKHTIVVALVAIVAIAVLAAFCVQARERAIRAEGSAAKDQALSSLLQKSIDQRAQDVKAAESKASADIKALTPATAQQVITRIVTVHGAPVAAPVVDVTKEELASGEAVAKLPDSPSYTVLTQDQSMAIAKNQIQCDLAQTKLTACTADADDYKKQIALANDRADAYEKALKGGSWLQRVWRVAKPVGCAIGGAAAGSYAKGTQGAAVGAAAAGALCAVAF